MQRSFLQTPIWQEFQSKIGRKCFRIRNKLFIEQPLPFNQKYLYCPRVDLDLTATDWNDLVKNLESEYRQIYLCAKIEPNHEEVELSKLNNFYLGPTIQPTTTLVTDLKPSLEQIKTGFKSKTRYNLNLAQKKEINVEIIDSDFEKEISEFLELLKITAARNQFNLHSPEYYQKMFFVLGKAKMIYLLKAKYQKECLAAMILIIFNNQAIYLHGASSNQNRQLMAPYLLHWQAIQFAKTKDCQSYDWWGVNKNLASFDPAKDNFPSSLDGVSRFKLGFGGKIVNYSQALEIPLNKFSYALYRQFRQAQKIFQPKIYH